MNNFDTSSPFGTIDLTNALAYSVNSVFCNIGKKLGAKKILDTAKRFGFYERPPLETPSDERLASGLYDDGRLFYPKVDANVDAGRMAFGQERMLVTALQNAMVAGAIGVGGQAHGAARRQPHRRPRRQGDRAAAAAPRSGRP